MDIHCVTRWSKLRTTWRGVSLGVLLADIDICADYAMAHSYGGYTTNLPLAALLHGKAWIAYESEGEPREPIHGGPARYSCRTCTSGSPRSGSTGCNS